MADRSFTNELGNRVRITIEGLSSISENILTPMEARELKSALGETGWLVEEEAGGLIHWIALEEVRRKGLNLRDPLRGGRADYTSPIRFVKDASEAIRFARKQDAEAFIATFCRSLINPKATEHEWPPCAKCDGAGRVPDDMNWRAADTMPCPDCTRSA